MNFNLLTTFVAVVDEGNYSRAAASLQLSQPAVSMQMQTLSQELGVELLRRRGHRMETTEAGTLLYRQARTMLRNWQGLVNSLDSLRRDLQGRLNLGASTVPGDYILPPVLCDFYQHNPEVDIRLTVAPSKGIIECLCSGDVDVAVVGFQPDISGFVCKRLRQEELVVVFAPGHPFDGRSVVQTDDLLNQPLVLRTRGSATRQVLEDALAAGGKNLPKERPVMELGSNRAVLEAVARGLGVAVVSRLAADDFITTGRLKWLRLADIDVQRSFWLVRPKDKLSAAAEAFVEYLEGSEGVGKRNQA